jgi:heme-degrading monooxygenase HmoA
MFSPLFHSNPPAGAQRDWGFAVLGKFIAAEGKADEVKEALRHRPHQAEHASGFVGMEVLCPCDRPDEFWFMTLWADRESFRAWHHGPDTHEAPEGLPQGFEPAHSETRILEFEHVSASAPPIGPRPSIA